ncbi:MAG: hypothetical protein WAS73_02895 [Defluviicoccus sp.]
MTATPLEARLAEIIERREALEAEARGAAAGAVGGDAAATARYGELKRELDELAATADLISNAIAGGREAEARAAAAERAAAIAAANGRIRGRTAERNAAVSDFLALVQQAGEKRREIDELGAAVQRERRAVGARGWPASHRSDFSGEELDRPLRDHLHAFMGQALVPASASGRPLSQFDTQKCRQRATVRAEDFLIEPVEEGASDAA